MNTWSGIGNLTKDVELRYSGENPRAKFTLACSGYADHTDFIFVTVFGKQAENCNMYLKKGSKAGVTGRLNTGSYEKDGKTVYTWDIVADRVEFLDKKEKKEEQDIYPDDLPF